MEKLKLMKMQMLLWTICMAVLILLFQSLIFPNSLKLADATPIPKKGMKELKEDYRSVSILPSLSKIFERIMCVQISASFDNGRVA